MASLNKELIILILQYLDEEKFRETVRKLEQESAFFFNMKYFEEGVRNGNWDEVDKYLSAFTKINDNRYSMKTFFEIRKQKYLEALDKHDRPKAIDILVKELKVFASFNEELYKELTQLLTLQNFRENEHLSKYGDARTARAIMLVELKKLIEANPLLRDKLQFPTLRSSRLRTLINQSLNWQHQLCKNPRPNPDIKTLFIDHSCAQPSGMHALASTSSALPEYLPRAGGFPPSSVHMPLQLYPTSVPAPVAGWMSVSAAATHPVVPSGATVLTASANPSAALKHLRTPPTMNPARENPSVESDYTSKRIRAMGISNEANMQVNMLPVIHPQNHHQVTYNPDDLPKTVVRTLNQGSTPMSLDFHPTTQTLLLVGTNVGDIGLWDLGTNEKLAHRNFKVWELGSCSMSFQNALAKDPRVSVNRIIWSPDGSLFGVAYSRHVVQIYSYHGGDAIKQHLEIDAHVGGVNDISFAQPNRHLCIITCGDDKLIKVWDAVSGTKQYTFEGHEAPVFCVCPHYKENIQFIFSAALDGKIKAWLYDNLGSRVDYDAPGHWCTTLAYSADGSRLFSCGTSKSGESYLVEWNESEGAVKRTYEGFRKQSLGVVQFDTTKNRFLAVGDEFVIKIWDMDNANLLTTIEADGGLPASPRVRFNKEGTLMAISAQENGIKILANADGLRMLCPTECHPVSSKIVTENATRPVSPLSIGAAATSSGASPAVPTPGMNGDVRNLVDVKPRIAELVDKAKISKLTEINDPARCRSLRLIHNMKTSKISRLIYTNSGVSLLALASNAIHFLWKWPRNDPRGKATASLSPQLWQPPSGIMMTNDTTNINPEEAISCFALSKNDSYVMSASGGKISLFNMTTFKTMTTFMPPPPTATFLAFHPQDNNVIAVGMDDSTIQIYNARVDKVKNKLIGHSKRISGLAFSNFLNVLVSAGADAQLSVWGFDGWEKQRTTSLQMPSGHASTTGSDTLVEFHRDQIHFLVVHETQIALYETKNLECMKQWAPPEGSSPIVHATFSCDSQGIFVSFLDAAVCIFSAASFKLMCRINPAAYLHANVSDSSSNVYPTVIAAHPSEPNQFALGLTDGSVHVLEPLEADGKWGVDPAAEDGSPPAASSTSDQPQK